MKFQVAALFALLASLAAAQTLNIPTRSGKVIALPSPSVLTAGVHDYAFKEFDRGMPCNPNIETGSWNAVFILKPGATLKNVIIGPNAWEGVHCEGACTLRNVYFRHVCEDAITLKGNGSVSIVGGGAQNAKDKVVQHNGRGTVVIKHYTVVNAGKLFRSCGNCIGNGGPRNVILMDVKAKNLDTLVGINTNYGDLAYISTSCATNVKKICQEMEGVRAGDGKEMKKLTSTANCRGVQSQVMPRC